MGKVVTPPATVQITVPSPGPRVSSTPNLGEHTGHRLTKVGSITVQPGIGGQDAKTPGIMDVWYCQDHNVILHDLV